MNQTQRIATAHDADNYDSFSFFFESFLQKALPEPFVIDLPSS